ncbi:threonylcarbamoyl-AMP synthase [bacterium]|nr:threonylcarbamoyl-AMP synthase [bacterium]
MDTKKIAEILNNDGVIAFVTDTVWGIGCLPTSKKAVERIYEIKHRDIKKPLILMSNSDKYLRRYVKPLSILANELIQKHFPGALTLVIDKSDNTPDYITSGLETVGIRVPNNKTFVKICDSIDGHVLATTSANLSNEPAALTYEEAVRYIGDKVDLVIEDNGEKAQGRASTVAGISQNGITIFRQGDIKLTD